ncbi:MAG: PAS domain S-box protein [Candidatus Omnitrophica bacterium]|nr:PAS domain S-box protein [Candidatus Omnitrophota bacterium]
MINKELMQEIRIMQTWIVEFGKLYPKTSKLEQVLRSVKEQYEIACAEIEAGVVLADMKGKIIDANKIYRDMLGYTMDELRDLTYQQFTPPRWHKLEEVFVLRALRGEEYVRFEKEYIRKDGTVFPVSLTGWAIKSEEEEPLGTGSVVKDLSAK